MGKNCFVEAWTGWLKMCRPCICHRIHSQWRQISQQTAEMEWQVVNFGARVFLACGIARCHISSIIVVFYKVHFLSQDLELTCDKSFNIFMLTLHMHHVRDWIISLFPWYFIREMTICYCTCIHVLHLFWPWANVHTFVSQLVTTW